MSFQNHKINIKEHQTTDINNDNRQIYREDSAIAIHHPTPVNPNNSKSSYQYYIRNNFSVPIPAPVLYSRIKPQRPNNNHNQNFLPFQSEIVVHHHKTELEKHITRVRIRRADIISNYFLMVDYASVFVEMLFECKSGEYQNITVEAFITNIITRTRISTQTIIMAFLFLDRLKFMHPKCRGTSGSAYMLLMSAIILASKYSYVNFIDCRMIRMTILHGPLSHQDFSN
jgi:hypothetical protein